LADRMDTIIRLEDITKIYGNTTANKEFSICIEKGDVLGLVGANGAGKSTLMRVISGVTVPEQGEMYIDGTKIDWKHFSPSAAAKAGIHVAYQELSLCDNLKVYENFLVDLSFLFKGKRHWRKEAAELAQEKLEEIFPGNGINVHSEVSKLSIAQQQMVEIARASAAPDLKLLILDEPTSSLPAEQTNQLLSFIRRRSGEGISFIYITHRLFEIMEITNKICVMKNGGKVWEGNSEYISEEELIEKMGTAGAETKDSEPEKSCVDTEKNDEIYVKCTKLKGGNLEDISCEIYGGQVIGIAGLEGNGQQEFLKTIFQASRRNYGQIKIQGKMAYVTGNRKEEGNFSLWSIADNIAVTALTRRKLYKSNSPGKIVSQTEEWYQKLNIKGESIRSDIISLSGGNQQKVLIARALFADADIIILDDPTRGVDIETKRQLYQVFKEAARKGKLVIWYSSDDSELDSCNKVFVMRYGTIISELAHGKISKEAITQASFSAKDKEKEDMNETKKRSIPFLIPLVSLIIVYVCCGMIQPSTFTIFGAELLISGSIPLIMAALGQVFIIGLSHTDLGIGNYMGLVSVITATVMCNNSVLGIVFLCAVILAYSAMGFLICTRNIPAVIVTLGGSFIWTGMAYVLQDMPGGSSPALLTVIFNSYILGIPSVIYIALLSTVLAVIIYRSKYGTVLRGFGNREEAVIRSGWSKKKAFTSVYFLSACFAALGGMAFTAITYSSDAEAMTSYTLLTVAAVILGGGSLTGGRVSHGGAVCGALTLSMVTILLGFLHISTDLTAAVQGILLILILSLRLLKREEQHE
jgi:ribose transport system ATP-binding protein